MIPSFARRTLLLGAAAFGARAEARNVSIAFANITEDPSVRLEGTGFTGSEVRDSFSLAARGKPIELVLYDNARDRTKALENAADAARRRVDVYVQYGWDDAVNVAVGRVLAEAEIPVLAINRPVPDAPLYGYDDDMAGRIAGEALARHARENWGGRPVEAVIVGPAIEDRIAGVAAGLKAITAAPIRIDTQGNPQKAEGLLRGFLASRPGRKLLVATLDDATALAAKSAIEGSGRHSDAVIVSHGCDRAVHGNTVEKKELDPANRGSLLLGSVAFFMDRYGYDVLPLAMALAARQPVPPRTVTQHQLVTPANAFVIYPPIDMN